MTGELRNNHAEGHTRFPYGLCAVDDRYLVTTEDYFSAETYSRHRQIVCLYEVTTNKMNILDTHLELSGSKCPVTDGHGNIFVPYQDGVAVVRIVNNGSLALDRTLTDDGKLVGSHAVAVVNDTTLCVIVSKAFSSVRIIYLVDIITDTVLDVLHPPEALEGNIPEAVASIFGSILIAYRNRDAGCKEWSMLLYGPGIAYRTVLKADYLESAKTLSADPYGRFLVVDYKANTIWVLSLTGDVVAKVKAGRPGCVAVSIDGGRLYVGNRDSDTIAVFQ